MALQNLKIWDALNNRFAGVTYKSNVLGPLTVTADGVLTNANGVGLTLENDSYKLTNNGVIGSTALGQSGISVGAGSALSSFSNITNSSSGEVFGFYGIYLNGRADVINAGSIVGLSDGIIDIFAGDNTIKNTGTISGNFTSVYSLAAGVHTINNSGTLIGEVKVTGLNSVALFTNKGVLHGDVTFADGDNVLTNTGLINGEVFMGSGNDTFTNSGSMTFGAGIQLGAGDDLFKGGKAAESITDQAGNDKYTLGDGYDLFHAVALGSGGAFIDTVDGGANKGENPNVGSSSKGDTYDARDATNDLIINLDTVTHQESAIGAQVYIASHAQGLDVGSDEIKNFESANGGSGADVIFGNAKVNLLIGNEGHDVIHGYDGDDVIVAGVGSDFIFGDKGADTLTGGANANDGIADYFFYGALSDSTVAKAGRDTIQFFEDGKDQIIFQGIAGHTGGDFVGVNVAFTPIAGQLEARALKTLSGWNLQIDTNGDGKADMAINVADKLHAITWADDNFLF
jgi:Ca2+-binding RTX toxin-like protein